MDGPTGTRISQCFLALALLLGSLPALAGSRLGDFVVAHWGTENGLPDNSVTCLAQTHDGYLWVGSAAGLARFDGVKFAPLKLVGSSAPASNEITALFEDANDRLWIGTRTDGLWSLAAGVLSRPEPDLAGLAVTCVAGGSGGELWVGTPNGLRRFGGTNSIFTMRDGLPSDFVSGVHVSSSGTVWITTRKGMCQFKEGRLTPLEFQTDSPGRSPEMIGMYDDQRGNLWAFGDTYLVNLNDGKRFNYFRNGDTTSLRIWSLCEGRDGQLWIGTSGQGVFSFADGRFRPLSLRDATLGSDVQAIYEDREGSLWLGTFGGGLLRLQPRRAQVLDTGAGLPAVMANCLATLGESQLCAGYENAGIFLGTGEGFDKPPAGDGMEVMNLITSMGSDSKGGLWLGTLGLGLIRTGGGISRRLTTENGLADDDILAVAVQGDDTIWAGTRGGILQHITDRGVESYNYPPAEAISCILVGSSNRVWVGTESGGFGAFEAGRFDCPKVYGPLAGAPVRALCEDKHGRLWIGTQGRGLACFAEDRLAVWDVKTGFPDDDVNALAADDFDKIWVCTRKGLYVMPRSVGPVESGIVPAVQPVQEFAGASAAVFKRGWPQVVKTKDGRIWFATPNGLCGVDPKDFRPVHAPLQVELGRVLINGRPDPAEVERRTPGARVSKPLRLPSNLHTLEIEYTVPSVNWPERIQFQHRLDPFDGDWVDGGNERHVRYSGLSFGQYRFRVRAMNLDGNWGQENAVLLFELPPPLWRSPGVLGAEGLLAASAVAGGARLISHRRLRRKLAQLGQQQAMERERMRIARDMHDELGSKLTRISYLSELALEDEAASRKNLTDIAQNIRDLLQTVDEIVWAVDPQNDTLENLAAYLGHYVVEYLQNTTVECQLNIAPDLPLHPLTAETRHNLFLAFEEAVGNALKHSGATRLRVDMSQTDGSFEISIQDNGRGFAAPLGATSGQPAAGSSRKRSHGLVNMRQRLASIGGEARIQSQPGQGVTVTFVLPIKARPTQAP